ncbi:flagellar hook-length control protein FliK [Roseivivax halodurans]|nr:flagellar hook-length control protein FliK [Roseivivax halodurans]
MPSDVAELLSELHAEMADDLATLPGLSPAGLERLERAMAGKIAEHLAAFDAEQGGTMLHHLGGGSSADLANRLFRGMTEGRPSAPTPLLSLNSAFAQVATALGIGTSQDTETGRLVFHPAGAPQGSVSAPKRGVGHASHRGDVERTDTLPNSARTPRPETSPPPRGLADTRSGTAGGEARSADDGLRGAPSAPDQPRIAPTPPGPAAPAVTVIPARPAEPQGPPVALPPAAPAAPVAPTGTAPVPAPAAPPAPPEPPVLDQIRRVGVTTGRTRIELTPEGLGPLEIDLSADEAGQLRIVLRAENPAILSMLRGDRAGLLSALGEGGVPLGDAGLDFETFGGDGRDRPAPDAQRGPSAEEPAEGPSADPASYRPRPVEGRLDILT